MANPTDMEEYPDYFLQDANGNSGWSDAKTVYSGLNNDEEYTGTARDLQLFMSKTRLDNQTPWTNNKWDSRKSTLTGDSLNHLLSPEASGKFQDSIEFADITHHDAQLTGLNLGTQVTGYAAAQKALELMATKNPAAWKRIAGVGLGVGTFASMLELSRKKGKSSEELQQALKTAGIDAATWAAFEGAIVGGSAAWNSDKGKNVRGKLRNSKVGQTLGKLKLPKGGSGALSKTASKYGMHALKGGIRLLGPWGLAASVLWIVGENVYDSYQEAEANKKPGEKIQRVDNRDKRIESRRGDK